MDLLDKYIKDCSPYIEKLTYDLEKREVIIVFIRNMGGWQHEYLKHGQQLKFTDVIGFKENICDMEGLIDDDITDSIIGFYKTSSGWYCLETEKRELRIQTMKEPTSTVLSD
ncbi:MAG: hypothetical protein ABJ275_10160 [Maricaulaceae bacterium]